MIRQVKAELEGLGITNAAAIPLSLCKILRPYKLERCGFAEGAELFAIMLTIPYLTEVKDKNISSYAIPCDYHLFCKELFDAVIPRLREKFPQNAFFGFADNSPIDEVNAAARAGLGIIGDHGMLITREHSSYVFIAEIITDLPLDRQGEYKILHCEVCGRCSAACPKLDCGECLSAVTQKKGELTESEISIIKRLGCAWGCDTCSEVCPHTERALANGTIYTDVPFFKENLTPTLTSLRR